MLRQTLWFLLEKETPPTIRRAVMAKIRPNSGSSSGTGGGGVSGASALSSKAVATSSQHHSPLGTAPQGYNGVSLDERVSAAIQSGALASLPSSAAIAAQLVEKEKEGSDKPSEDAYQFLLHHIDSEIAALTRRVAAVGKQRENVEGNQSRRIRDLFECIERPWLLLESIPAPQLPNKALDVYAKELYIRQRGNSTSDWGEDAVFLTACKRNWRAMTIEQRKPYEIAARRNEQTRKELKKNMNNGCSFFESLCEKTKEWTA
ncbi:hypothetical protein, conserved, partial [Trypanosoma vivax Y486]